MLNAIAPLDKVGELGTTIKKKATSFKPGRLFLVGDPKTHTRDSLVSSPSTRTAIGAQDNRSLKEVSTSVLMPEN
ncbi:hypothetical protein GCM10010912_48020 [Paenibacillus albidus]|uniref:Uncharacterized protein n=1 Tax=Paenibacillus albidus TaxID=2041023 RepID=A0A917CTY1_9BACL|nr:hypothetical protein GCM10010912_48020 [Paenibacillus albidus]